MQREIPCSSRDNPLLQGILLISAHCILLDQKYKRGVIQKQFVKLPSDRNSGWTEDVFGNFFIEQSIRTSDTVTTPLASLTVEQGITPKTERYYREFLITKEGDSYKEVHQNWFAYNPMNAHIGAIAANHLDYNASVSGYYNVFSLKYPETVWFWEEFLTSHQMLLHYKVIATGSLIEKQRVHFSQFLKIKRSLPPLEEQRRLSKLFETLNRRLKIEQNTYAAAELLRKSLMQQLFI